MKIQATNSSDYASLDNSKYSFYYGYEELDENDNWCFTCRVQNTSELLIRYSSKELNCEGDYPEIALLKGVGKFIDEWLILKEE